MSRVVCRVRFYPIYNQVRYQETSAKITPITDVVPPAVASEVFEPKIETIKVKPVSSIDIKLPDVQPVPIDTSLKIVQSFEDIPGPRIFKYMAATIRLVPSVGKFVTAGTVQYILNRLVQYSRLWIPQAHLLSGSDSRVIRLLFEEYGPVVRLEVPFGGNMVVLSRPEHVRAVFQNEGPFPIRSSIDCVEKYRLQYRNLKQAGSLVMNGPEWDRLRSKINNPLEKMVQVQSKNLELSCDRLVQRIKHIRNPQEETSKEFYKEIYKWSMDCLSHVAFNKNIGFLDMDGLSMSSESTVMLNALLDASKAIQKCEDGFKLWKLFETYNWKNLVRHLNTLDCIFSKYIGAIQLSLKDKENTQTLGSSLVETLMLKEDLSTDDILTVLVDFMILGVNTTSHAMGYMMYYLAKNPKVQKKLYNEIKANKGYENQPYLEACIKECLRLQPPIPILSRVLPTDLVIHNYRIPKGTLVLMAPSLESLKNENFDDPLKYNPDRWLAEDDEAPMLASMPFGYGQKACLAQKLAMLQLSMLTSKIVKNFMIQYNYGDIIPRSQILAPPKRPLKFRFIERNGF